MRTIHTSTFADEIGNRNVRPRVLSILFEYAFCLFFCFFQDACFRQCDLFCGSLAFIFATLKTSCAGTESLVVLQIAGLFVRLLSDPLFVQSYRRMAALYTSEAQCLNTFDGDDSEVVSAACSAIPMPDRFALLHGFALALHRAQV